MIGVISPSGIATATLISTSSYWAMPSSVQLAFTVGTRRSVAAVALITRSLMVMQYAPGPSFGAFAFSSRISGSAASISMSIDT